MNHFLCTIVFFIHYSILGILFNVHTKNKVLCLGKIGLSFNIDVKSLEPRDKLQIRYKSIMQIDE